MNGSNQKRKHSSVVPMALVLGSISGLASAGDIHVPQQFGTIQTAINAANNGDTVLVAPGSYNEAINFNGKAITVRGSGGSTVTTIDAASLNTTVVKFITAEGPNSVLEGFTITNGRGTTVDSFTRAGGGIYVIDASPTLIDCDVFNNRAIPSGTGTGVGGGVYVNNSNLMIVNSKLRQNSANGMVGGGGGFYCYPSPASHPVMIDCEITDNSCFGGALGFGGSSGGGLSGGNGTFINCLVQDNSAGGSGSASGGGAASGSLYVNCRFTNNSIVACCGSGALASGAGLSTAAKLINCTISNNSATGTIPPVDGGVSGSSATLINCIVFGNTADEISPGASVSNSCVEGGFPGPGNISGNPMFVNPDGGDFRLLTGSPCIDTADISQLIADTDDLDADGNTLERHPIDLDGLCRVVNGFLDMGAFEWQRTCLPDIAPSSPGVAGNGLVNVDDLLVVINSWGGACDGCVGDVDGNDVVNVDDLLAVINGWGRCR